MSGVTCPSCGHENTVGSRFCSSCGTSLGEDQDTTTVTFSPGETGDPDAAETPVPEVEVDLSDVPVGTGVLVVTRGEAAGSRILLDLANDLRRPPSEERHLPRRHHGLAAPRRDHPRGRPVPGPRRRLAERHLREPGAHRRGPAEHGDVLQVGKYKLHFLVAGVV